MDHSHIASHASLFVYGTLQSRRVLSAVLGRVPESRAAALTGFRRGLLSGTCYPALVPDAGGLVAGRVLHGLDAHEWRLLDAYEGDTYERRVVLAELEASQCAEVFVYVLRCEWHHLLSHGDFDLERFEREDAERFVRELG